MAKEHVMEANLLEDEDVNSENKAENLEVKDDDDMNMSTIDLYSHAVTIVCKHSRKQNTTDCLESSVPSHLYYFLRIVDDASMINYGICYNLNVLKPDF